MARAKASVEAMSERYNTVMKWNPTSKHSRKAHIGAKYAESLGKADAYHEAVFVAQFQQEKNIDDIETLVAIAATIGLDGVAFRNAVKSRQDEHRIDEDEDIAQQLGITGIPCFIVGNRGAMGLQGVADLEMLLADIEE